MESREQLEKRVTQLEKQFATLTTGRTASLRGMRGIRKRSAWSIGSIPLYDLALGPDLERGELRGHAKGIIAIGDLATGVLAIGGLSRGAIAFGGVAVGLLGFGGLSVGVVAAIGGLAIGSIALGGAAVGGVAVGGGAAGYYYACGGKAFGQHAVDARRRDPEAQEFFRRVGAAELCRSR